MAWLTPAEARQGWPDAPTADADLQELLDSAQHQVEEYAPALADPAAPPPHYRQALRLQTQELWRARRRDSDVIGSTDLYAIRARPLTDTVRSLLRPPSGRPVVG